MHKWKFIKCDRIEPYLEAIKGCDSFYVADKDDYKVINYHFVDKNTFPDPNKLSVHNKKNAKLRRDCRGIIFDNDGNVIRKPYHKFFNIEENEENSLESIDMKYPHIILNKLDGSMISPFLVNDKLIFGSKMGKTEVSEQVEEWLKRTGNLKRYSDFSLRAIQSGYSPIFEWTSPQNKIVIDYNESNLILTAFRHMNSGKYADIHIFST